MLKEIHEQPRAVAETVVDRLAHGRVELGDIGITDDELRGLRRVVIVACGTVLPRRPDRPVRHRDVVAACRWRWTWPPSSATATR